MLAHNKIYGSVFSKISLQFHTISSRESLLSTLLVALNSSHFVSCCTAIHARVLKSLNYRDGFIGDQLVSSYITLGFVDDAEKLFDEIPHRDLVSWNSLISGFSKRGDLSKCLSVFLNLKSELTLHMNELTIIPIISACTSAKARHEGQYLHGNAVKLGMKLESKIANSLINMYGKFGCLDSAFRLFWEIPERNLVSWNSIVAICTQNGFPEEAFQHFNMMKHSGFCPDQATIVSLLQACENLPIVKSVEAIHGVILTSGLNENVTIATSILILYSKLGRLHASHKIFKEISNPDKVAWSAMISAYAMHGQGETAIELFEKKVRQGMKPDHVTFTHLLSACSHSGLVDKGKYYFHIMSDVYGIQPRLDHYSCMVDLLGRRGLLNDAYELIQNMPLEPNAGVWGALLGACRVYRNTNLGIEVAEKMIELDALDSRNYIMLSNIYSSAGLWDDASKVRASMNAKGLIRIPGISYIEHRKKIHRFLVDDYLHPEANKIHEKLEELVRKIHEAGFVTETESVLHNVDEEVKMDMVNKHSEKIALAYGLLVASSDEPIVIMKNLRICRDCHSTVKFVSMIEKRMIIIRDSKRFHQFLDGSCSCGDYW